MLGGVSRPEPGPGRGAGMMLGDVKPGSMVTTGVLRRNQVHFLGSNQQHSRTLGRLLWRGWTPMSGTFSGLAWSSRYSQTDPRPTDARGHGSTQARAGLGRGAGLILGDVNAAEWLLQLSNCATQFVSWEATSSLYVNSEGCFGEAGPHAWHFSGLAWWSRYSQANPPAGDAIGHV